MSKILLPTQGYVQTTFLPPTALQAVCGALGDVIISLPMTGYSDVILAPTFYLPQIHEGYFKISSLTKENTPEHDAFIKAWGRFCMDPYPFDSLDMFAFETHPGRVWILPDGIVFAPNDVNTLFNSSESFKKDFDSFAIMTWCGHTAHQFIEANERAKRLAEDFSLKVFRPSMFRPILQRHKSWAIKATAQHKPL